MLKRKYLTVIALMTAAVVASACGNEAVQEDVVQEEGIEFSTFGEGFESWKEAYLAYYTENCPENEDGFSYSLIYVDDDDIPELVVDTGIQAGGCQILSYCDGTVSVLQTNRRCFTYIEKSGLLCNDGGQMSFYFDYVYRLDNGVWSKALSGEYYYVNESVGSDGEGTEDNVTVHYEIDGEELDKETYHAKLDAVYDPEKAVEPDRNMSSEDLQVYLK